MPETESGTRWNVFQLLLAVLMVLTGSINTLAAKWADRLKDKEKHKFDHPFVQAICMFIGEFLCLLAFLILFLYRKYRHSQQDEMRIEEEAPQFPKFNMFIFLPPACCDIMGTSIQYVGLNLTHASSYQMLRGAVIIFTGLLSVAFLRQILRGFRWFGMGLVCLGLVVVGLADIVFGIDKKADSNAVITGDLLIVAAQIIVAIQMVYEQKYIMKYDVPPLLAVGLEGLFGMTILSLLLIPMYYVDVPKTFSGNPFHRLEDVWFAFRQMAEDTWIMVALSGTIISIAFFNFAGISVTKESSATTRMVLDSVRTLFIWIFCLAIGWQNFVGLQIFGFILLILGMFVYNDLIFGPWFRQAVLSRLNNLSLSRCCFSFWGIDVDLEDEERLMRSEEDNPIA